MRFLTATLFIFVALGLTGSGCATGDTNISTGSGPQYGVKDAGTDRSSHSFVGSCNPMFCTGDPMGPGCCIGPNGPCGVDHGHGCVRAGRDGG